MASSTHTAPSAPAKRDRTHYLYIAVIVAVALGIAVGLIAPDFAVELKPIGTGFVNLIKMMISPIIFCTIVLGIGSVRKAAKVGAVGGIALAYFTVMSLVALGIGLVVGNIVEPGTGLAVTDAIKETGQAQVSAEAKDTTEFLLGIIPTTIVSAFTGGEVLQTLLVALFAGFALQAMGDSGQPILRGVEHIQRLVFRILAMVMWAAPIGAFGAIAAVTGSAGIDALKSLAVLMLGFYITCFLFVFIVLGALLRIVAGMNILTLFKYLGREFLLILSTSSSESALPRLIAKMEHLGVSKPVVGITVPTGYSFNLDGTMIYMTMASLFIADAMGTPMSVGEQIPLLLFLLVASKGAAGVTGSRPRDPRGWSAVPQAGPGGRYRPHRRHRPLHERGPRPHQLRGQRGRHGPHRYLDQGDRQGARERGSRRAAAVRREDAAGRRARVRGGTRGRVRR